MYKYYTASSRLKTAESIYSIMKTVPRHIICRKLPKKLVELLIYILYLSHNLVLYSLVGKVGVRGRKMCRWVRQEILGFCGNRFVGQQAPLVSIGGGTATVGYCGIQGRL